MMTCSLIFQKNNVFMKSLFAYIAITILISACTNTNDPQNVSLGGIDKYILESDKETSLSISKEIFNSYDSISGSFGDISIPLHRAIKGDNYMIYIGLPINTSIDEIEENAFANVKGKNKRSFTKMNDFFIFRKLISDAKSKRMYMFTLTSPDSTLVSKYYRKNDAQKKIKFTN